MSHFAKLDSNNNVLEVLSVHDNEASTEENGINFLKSLYGSNTIWKQTSYNTHGNTHKLGGTPFRGNYATINGTYDPINDVFLYAQPYNSWSLNSSYLWEAPLDLPELTEEQISQNSANTHTWVYLWNEEAYQTDNNTGWVLTNTKA